MQLQTKGNPLERCEFKFTSDHYGIEGYGNTTGVEDLGGDTVHPGAYKKTLEKNNPILMRFEHMPHMVPGKWLGATEDSKGLAVEGELTKGLTLAEDARLQFKHGTLTGLSIGYRVPNRGFEWKEDGWGRDIYEVDLVEASLTSTPMEQNSQIANIKSEIATLNQFKDFEAFLRDSGGLSRKMATAFVGQFKTFLQGEPAFVRDEQTREINRKAEELKGFAKTLEELNTKLES